jgi:hypothetical protein
MMLNDKLPFRVHAYGRDGDEIRTLNVRAASRDRALAFMRRTVPGASEFRIVPLPHAPSVYFDA